MLGVPLSPWKIILNYLCLGWLAKLPGNGHLWFITMIIFVYVEFVCLTRVRRREILLVLLLLQLPLSLYLSYKGLPGYSMLMLVGCGLVFLYAPAIKRQLDGLGWRWTVGLYLIAHAVVIPMFVARYIEIGHAPYYYMTLLTGMASFVLLYKVFSRFSPCRFLLFTSAISFEFYLVHHPMSNYQFFMPLVHNATVAVALIFVLSYLSAYVLNKVSALIKNKL